MFARRPVKRNRRGRYTVTLGPEERTLLRNLPEQLKAVLAHTEEPALRRLFPPAYNDPDDAELAEEYKRLMTEDLVARHGDALDVLAATADANELSAEQLEGWMRAINSLRLVLGTTLDVTEEDVPTADMSPDHALYYFLGYLQECVVEALSGEG